MIMIHHHKRMNNNKIKNEKKKIDKALFTLDQFLEQMES